MSNEINAAPAMSETKSMSPWSMLVSIFVEPSKVFLSIKEKPTWLVPLIIILCVVAVSSYIVTPIAVQEQMIAVRNNLDMSEELRQQTLQGMETFGSPVIGAVTGIIFLTIMIFAFTGIVMLVASVIMGGKAKFSQVFSVVVVSSLIWIVSSIVKTPLIMSKGSVDVRTSLALLLPGDAIRTPLYHFLNTYTDVFFIWETILVIIGIKIVYDFAMSKSALAVLIPTGILALITTGLSALGPR